MKYEYNNRYQNTRLRINERFAVAYIYWEIKYYEISFMKFSTLKYRLINLALKFFNVFNTDNKEVIEFLEKR